MTKTFGKLVKNSKEPVGAVVVGSVSGGVGGGGGLGGGGGGGVGFFFQAEDGIRDTSVTGVQTCALPICSELNLSRLKELDIKFVHGDIRLSADLEPTMFDVDTIIDCSAEPSVLAGFASPQYVLQTNLLRSEERRVGKECRSRWSPYH